MLRGKSSSSSAFDAHFINLIIRVLLRCTGGSLNEGREIKGKLFILENRNASGKESPDGAQLADWPH